MIRPHGYTPPRRRDEGLIPLEKTPATSLPSGVSALPLTTEDGPLGKEETMHETTFEPESHCGLRPGYAIDRRGFLYLLLGTKRAPAGMTWVQP